MLCSERNCETDIENHLLSYPFVIEKYDLLAGLVNSWTTKTSGTTWRGFERDKKICQHQPIQQRNKPH